MLLHIDTRNKKFKIYNKNKKLLRAFKIMKKKKIDFSYFPKEKILRFGNFEILDLSNIFDLNYFLLGFKKPNYKKPKIKINYFNNLNNIF